jgi:hypothetical protein
MAKSKSKATKNSKRRHQWSSVPAQQHRPPQIIFNDPSVVALVRRIGMSDDEFAIYATLASNLLQKCNIPHLVPTDQSVFYWLKPHRLAEFHKYYEKSSLFSDSSPSFTNLSRNELDSFNPETRIILYISEITMITDTTCVNILAVQHLQTVLSCIEVYLNRVPISETTNIVAYAAQAARLLHQDLININYIGELAELNMKQIPLSANILQGLLGLASFSTQPPFPEQEIIDCSRKLAEFNFTPIERLEHLVFLSKEKQFRDELLSDHLTKSSYVQAYKVANKTISRVF